jgi:RNA polymerase sigma-70 factor, ECF subfamily
LANGLSLDIFEILVKENYDKVYRVIYYYTRDQFLSEDAVQQAFVTAYSNLHQLKAKDKFASWVITIALNEAKRMLKNNNCPTVTPITDAHLGKYQDNMETAIELKVDMNTVINKLKQKDTEILVLKYYADLTLQQIADFLGLNISNTKVRLHRAKEKFRDLFDQDHQNLGG